MSPARGTMNCHLVGGPFDDLVVTESKSAKWIALNTEGKLSNKFDPGAVALYVRCKPDEFSVDHLVEFYFKEMNGVVVE